MLLPNVGAVAASAVLAASGVAYALTVAASSSSNSDVGFIADAPPFDAYGMHVVTRCARKAQQKRHVHSRNKPNSNLNFRSFADEHRQLHASQRQLTLMGGALTNDANESYLNGLPIKQARYDSAHRKGALFCRSGNWLEIGDAPNTNSNEQRNQDEKSSQSFVRGVSFESTRFAILEFLAVAFGLVSIRGVASRNFLCMDRRGQLYAARDTEYTVECVFMEEMLENYYNLYSSCAYGTRQRPWYVALHKSGRTRKGRHTQKKQKSSHFLVTYFDANDDLEDKLEDGSMMSGKMEETLQKRKIGGDALFASYGHAATRVQPQLVLTVSNSDPTQWKSFYNVPQPKIAHLVNEDDNEDKKQIDKFSTNTKNKNRKNRDRIKQQHILQNKTLRNNFTNSAVNSMEPMHEKWQRDDPQQFIANQYSFSVQMDAAGDENSRSANKKERGYFQILNLAERDGSLQEKIVENKESKTRYYDNNNNKNDLVENGSRSDEQTIERVEDYFPNSSFRMLKRRKVRRNNLYSRLLREKKQIKRRRNDLKTLRKTKNCDAEKGLCESSRVVALPCLNTNA